MSEAERDRPPTLGDAEKLEAKAEELRGRLMLLEGQEEELGEALAAAHAGEEAEELRRLREERLEAAVLRAELEAALPRLERQAAEAREAACKEAAWAWLVAIARVCGSLRAELEADAERLRRAAEEYAGRVEKLNERYSQLVALGAEAGALVDRFDLEPPDLPSTRPPARREEATRARELVMGAHLADWIRVKIREERNADFGFTRRSYAELGPNAPARRILEAAGLKPWPEPAPEERERLERQKARQAEQERRAREAFAVHMPTERASAGNIIPGR